MSRPTASDRSLDEEIRGWIAEAGDCRVEARAEHIDRTRHLLLERVVLPPEVVIRPDEPESAPLGVGLIRLSALTALIAAALFVAVYLSKTTGRWLGRHRADPPRPAMGPYHRNRSRRPERRELD